MEKTNKKQNQSIKIFGALSKLKQLIGDDKMIITGSTAFAFHGLTKIEDAHDVDIILIKKSETTIELLNRLQKESPSPRFKNGGSLNYSFFFEGIKVDVWVVDSYLEDLNLKTDSGYYIAPVSTIIKAKLSYNRPKDWVQLLKMSKIFFDHTKFDEVLSSINTDDDYPE